MARHELRRLAGIVETNTTILKARTVIATEWLMPVDSLQKQEGGYAPMSGGSGKRVGLWRARVSNYKIPAIIDY